MEAADEINDTDYVLDVQEELEMLEGADDSSHVKGMNNTQDPLAILYKYHPEAVLDYTDTIAEKIPLKVVPAGVTAEVDENHKSQPWLWQYERLLFWESVLVSSLRVPSHSLLSHPIS